MAVLGNCSLCRPAEYIKNKLENNKKEFLTYSFFMVLLIEWISFIYLILNPIKEQITDSYMTKVNPFLTNSALFIIVFSVFLWQDRLRFCFRKSATTFYLAVYYFFNAIAVLTCLNAYSYYLWVSIGLLSISTFLFIVSLLNSKK